MEREDKNETMRLPDGWLAELSEATGGLTAYIKAIRGRQAGASKDVERRFVDLSRSG